jgi:hypothetical protein
MAMTIDGYLVVIATSILVISCFAGVYLFMTSKKIVYRADKVLMDDNDDAKSPRGERERLLADEEAEVESEGINANAAGAGGREGVSNNNKNGTNNKSKSSTYELKKKMKKRHTGKMNTVDDDSTLNGSAVTLKDISDNGGVRGSPRSSPRNRKKGRRLDNTTSGDDLSSSDRESSVASSVHDDILRKTLLSVLADGGLSITQHRSNSEPKLVVLSLAGNVLQWKSKKLIARNSYSLNLADVTSILWGKHAIAFARYTIADVPDEVCFSLLTEDTSLDLQCSSKSERDTLVHGISLMVTDARDAKEGAVADGSPV